MCKVKYSKLLKLRAHYHLLLHIWQLSNLLKQKVKSNKYNRSKKQKKEIV